MSEHTNGAAAADQPEQPIPAAQAGTGQMTLDAQLDIQTRQIIGVMFRGLLVSAPGIPPDALIRSVARVTGEFCATAIVGDLAPVLVHRKAIKEAFTDAVGRAKVVPLPESPKQPLNG